MILCISGHRREGNLCPIKQRHVKSGQPPASNIRKPQPTRRTPRPTELLRLFRTLSDFHSSGNPSAWFIQAEARFELSRITSQTRKYFLVLDVRPATVIDEVSDFEHSLAQALPESPYDLIKAAILDRTAPDRNARGCNSYPQSNNSAIDGQGSSCVYSLIFSDHALPPQIAHFSVSYSFDARPPKSKWSW
ncbi:hypothetical protein HPB51_011267 [Rhipicephalus microplus]|uniref:DUF7041 domain-containing protein n=1 Tax=Rhipicephalus microplus TaxID=6941 RepID=A0A9J6DMF0_RHIMP|nr:hypothetical protein HPB51_011267 [Rhipicephalus microplus]